jgi:hypothetical protein
MKWTNISEPTPNAARSEDTETRGGLIQASASQDKNVFEDGESYIVCACPILAGLLATAYIIIARARTRRGEPLVSSCSKSALPTRPSLLPRARVGTDSVSGLLKLRNDPP